MASEEETDFGDLEADGTPFDLGAEADSNSDSGVDPGLAEDVSSYAEQLPDEVDELETAALAEEAVDWAAYWRNEPAEPLGVANGHSGQHLRRPPQTSAGPCPQRRHKRSGAGRPEPLASQPDGPVPLAGYELMTTLAGAAQKSRSTPEACQLVAAIVPLAAQLVTHYRHQIWPVLPLLIQGAASAAEVIHSQPASRPFIRLMPAILERTFRRLAQVAERGEPITRETAADVLAEYTGIVIVEHHRAGKRGRRSGSLPSDDWGDWGEIDGNLGR